MAEGESLEVHCLVALRDARASFLDEVVSRAHEHARKSGAEITKDDIDTLRSNETFQIAEFYYLVQKYNLADRGKIRSFLLRHNEDIRQYVSDKTKRDTLGLSKSRLEEGLFSDSQIQKVVHHINDGKLCLDQSDLARLLVTLISAETTRKAVLALAKAGLVNRVHIGNVLIVSNGVLETLFEQHLSSIVQALRMAFQIEKEASHENRNSLRPHHRSASRSKRAS